MHVAATHMGSDENPQISQIGADLLNLILSSMVIILSFVMRRTISRFHMTIQT